MKRATILIFILSTMIQIVIAQDDDAIFLDTGISKIWETKNLFITSESVLFDKKRDVLYVSNFDQPNVNNPDVFQHISKLSLSGDIIDLKWVDSLKNPLGITIFDDKLFVTERKRIAEIDLETGKVVRRYPLPESLFLNDIAIDDQGVIYSTDSRKSVIWRIKEGSAEEWLSGDEVKTPNVMYIKGNELFFGSCGDQLLKCVDLRTKSIRHITDFEPGFIDGFRFDENGNYLVSLWKGKVYRITPGGEKTKIIDSSKQGIYSADFEYIADKKLLIIPNFFTNKVTAFRIE